MNSAERTGRTNEEAIENALDALRASRDEVDVEVLQEPKPAILGFGGREARVRATRRPTPGALVQEVATHVLGLMGYAAAAEIIETPESVAVTLRGQDLSGLIGEHGRTLDALEFLVGLHVTKRAGRKVLTVLDADGYRGRREKALVEMAIQAADRAAGEGHPVALEPMQAKERRIIHLVLREDARVKTSSEGEEGSRHIVVLPVGSNELPGTSAS